MKKNQQQNCYSEFQQTELGSAFCQSYKLVCDSMCHLNGALRIIANQAVLKTRLDKYIITVS